MTIIVAALCLFGGLVLFFRPAPHKVSVPHRSPPHTSPPVIEPTAGELVAPPESEGATLRPQASVPDPSPSFTSPGNAPQPAAEISLPPPPSGDYELNLTNEQTNAIVEKRYGGLFPSLGLPAEQLARLRQLLAERQQVTVDAANAALLTGVNPVRELSTMRSAIEQAQATVDTMIRNELGETVLNACRDFDLTLRERNLAGDFSRLLAATGEPHQPELERQLVLILKNFPEKDAPADADRAIFGGINTRAQISEQAMTEAATVLSPRQLELLRQLQQHGAAH